jgi:hypothetical protein
MTGGTERRKNQKKEKKIESRKTREVTQEERKKRGQDCVNYEDLRVCERL